MKKLKFASQLSFWFFIKSQLKLRTYPCRRWAVPCATLRRPTLGTWLAADTLSQWLCNAPAATGHRDRRPSRWQTSGSSVSRNMKKKKNESKKEQKCENVILVFIFVLFVAWLSIPWQCAFPNPAPGFLVFYVDVAFCGDDGWKQRKFCILLLFIIYVNMLLCACS